MEWKIITDVILAISFIALAAFIVLGIYQWVTRKSLKKVDKRLLWLPLPLALMAITYFVFDKIWILNTRPNGSGEPSFPSTHVMVVATIFFRTTINLAKYVKNAIARVIIEIAMVVLLSLVCMGRVLSDMHWVSDVIGALVFAFIFSEIYYFVIHKLVRQKGKNAKHLHPNN